MSSRVLYSTFVFKLQKEVSISTIKEGQQGEESNNKPKRAYKPKRKANVSWSNKTAQKEATEEDIVYRAEHSDADDEQEGNYIQQRQKLTVRRRIPVSLQED
ncbi:hypothetical protein ACET3Z_004805 [Daucus carota]